MTDFEHDVVTRKKLTYGARAKKNGSKSKKCTLPSDGMTKREWLDRCGVVRSWRMTEPLHWEQFDTMPDDLKKEYLDGIVRRYGVTMADIAAMFDQDYTKISKLCKKLRVEGFMRGRRMNAVQSNAFFDFLARREGKLELCDKNGNAVSCQDACEDACECYDEADCADRVAEAEEVSGQRVEQQERNDCSFRAKEAVFQCDSIMDAENAVAAFCQSVPGCRVSHFEVKVVFLA